MPERDPFREQNWSTVPIRDLHLTVEGTPLEPILQEFQKELEARGITRLRPHFYLSTEWGVPFGTVSIAIPFYLARPELVELQERNTGHVEGMGRAEILRYLRHEMGHVVNYAYRLFEKEEWVLAFGSITQPYLDDYRPTPFSRRYVRHLPGWYAQKHPDEDFAETFATWLTPRSSWRRKYRYWPALKKLKYVDSLMKRIRDEEPERTHGRLVMPVEDMDMLLAEHYGQRAERFREAAQGYVDDKLQEVFPPVRGKLVSVGDLLRKHHDDLIERVTRWSSLDEGEVRTILSKLQDRADALNLECRRREAHAKLLDLTALATSLAIDFAYTGRLTG
jgi:hypothetical protein